MTGKISFDPLWKMMKTKGLTSYRIRREKIISESTLQNLRQGRCITTDAIVSLCCALDCQPGDVLAYVRNQYPLTKITFLKNEELDQDDDLER